MADQFEEFLAREFTPPDRDADRAFVLRVQAHILLEERQRAERRDLASMLGIEILGLAAVAAGAFWILRSPAIASFAGESPAMLLLVLLAVFGFLILLFSSRPGSEPLPAGSSERFPALSSLSLLNG